MNPLKIPEHVAVIMDGNGRWAKMRGMPRLLGHRAGMKSVRRAVEYSHEKGIKFLTLFAFSIENWGRPKEEVQALMDLLLEYIDRDLPEMVEKGIRLNVIGNLDMIPENVRKSIDHAIKKTRGNKGLVLTLALSYSGRDELIRAAKRMMDDPAIQGGKKTVDEHTFRTYLDSSWVPDPDLLIRTSGEQRVSNFMLWQLAYTEIYISEKLWPQFTKKDFDRAMTEYSRRKRRFGLTGEQIGSSS